MEHNIWYQGTEGTGGGPPAGASPAGGVSLQELAEQIAAELQNTPEDTKLQLKKQHDQKVTKKLGLKLGYKAQLVEQAGWGVMYAPDTPQEVKDALQPLIARRTPTGQAPRVLTYAGQSARQFRQGEHGEDFGVVDPAHLPYYFLLVGPPGGIPFAFQHDLDVAHAVGRLYFETAGEYESYVQGVEAYEDAAQVGRQRRLAIFSTAHDAATQQSAALLADPLRTFFHGRQMAAEDDGLVTYGVTPTTGAAATHAALQALLEGAADKPALLFSASHGQRPAAGQELVAGAPVCQDLQPFAGAHVLDTSDVAGLVWFAFACHSAAVSEEDEGGPYFAYLPQRLLSRGALAFLGHVGSTWSYSYGFPGYGALTGTFESALTGMLAGMRLGHAFDEFDQRYLALRNELQLKKGNTLDQYLDEEPVEEDMVHLWTACQDTRAYILFGDPAVCLRPGAMA